MMRVLDLACGAKTLVDEVDVPLTTGRNWYRTSNGYVAMMFNNGVKREIVLLHRFLTNAPPKTHVDHINGNTLDNRRSNLRITTPSINQVNRRRLNRNNVSGIRGVNWHSARRKWRAQITVNGKNHHLGLFEDIDCAITRRRAAELSMWGEQCPTH